MAQWRQIVWTLQYHWKTALMWSGIGGISLVWGILLVSQPGHTTTVLHHSFADLVQNAETIVVGTVSTIHTEWDAASDTPYTLITVTDLDVRKGNPNRMTLTLQFVGGPTPDGTTLQIIGVPEFQLGDRVVLFIAGNTDQAIPLVGIWQGVYRVVFDAERDEDVLYTHAMQPLAALPDDRGGLVYDSMMAPLDAAATPLSLETLLQAIDQEVQHD